MNLQKEEHIISLKLTWNVCSFTLMVEMVVVRVAPVRPASPRPGKGGLTSAAAKRWPVFTAL